MNDTQFVAELAQFSSVQQLTSINTNLQQLQVAQAAGSQVADAGLIGKDVLFQSSNVQLTAGQPTNLLATLSGPAAKITATITDASGNVVRTETFPGAQPAGQVSLQWDGRNDGGQPLPSGTYTVSLTATDSSGNPVALTQESSAQVTGVSFASGVPQLIVDGTPLSLANVTQINQ